MKMRHLYCQVYSHQVVLHFLIVCVFPLDLCTTIDNLIMIYPRICPSSTQHFTNIRSLCSPLITVLFAFMHQVYHLAFLIHCPFQLISIEFMIAGLSPGAIVVQAHAVFGSEVKRIAWYFCG